MSHQKGFTLVELLVVIAIIGVLASVVLVGFPGVTKKAKDGRLKASMAQMRTLMASAFDGYGNYDNFSTTSEDMGPLVNDVQKNSFGNTYSLVKAPLSSSDSVCAFAPLNEQNGATWYCVDSLGHAGTTDIDPATTSVDYCSDIANPVVCPPIVSD
ncbi:MAG: type II secretion system protein [Candidatus Pacebacteria bacterium]|nr:type II secretion system protein [Candidatus Paceibacterota bacterium]